MSLRLQCALAGICISGFLELTLGDSSKAVSGANSHLMNTRAVLLEL